MTEEMKKQTEEAAQAETSEDTDTGTDAFSGEEVQETPLTEDQVREETEEGDTPEETSPEEAASESGEDPEEDVVDGEFVQAGPDTKKNSLFRRKKDKKDEKIEGLTDKLQRQMAEFDNFRKRTEKEKGQMFDLGARSVIEKILPVIDNFERGLAQAGESGDDPFVQGMEMVYKQLLTELDAIGVKPIEAEGKEFDPNLHNAVMHCEDESVGENIVVQELQKGYTYHDTVVRHSMVKVAN